jgi:uncharacterized protein (DUF58 family)
MIPPSLKVDLSPRAEDEPLSPLSRLLQTAVRAFQHRPQLKFTTEGRVFSLTTLGLGVAALNSGNNLLYLVLGMMLALILSSGVLSSLNLHRVQVRRRTSRSVHAGDRMEVKVELWNKKKRWPSMGITIDEPHLISQNISSASHKTPRSRSLYLFSLRSQTQEEISYTVPTVSRGIYLLRGARLHTQFPFGLFEKSIRLSIESKLIVYPKINHRGLKYSKTLQRDGDELQVDTPSAQPGRPIQRGHEEGPHSVRALRTSQRGEHLARLRPLRPDESIRWVHWRASAKRGVWITREFEPTSQLERSIFLNPYYIASDDLSPETLSQESDQWAHLVTTHCLHHLDRNEPLRLHWPDGTQREVSAHSREHEDLLTWLCEVELLPYEKSLSAPRGALCLSSRLGVELIQGAHFGYITPPTHPDHTLTDVSPSSITSERHDRRGALSADKVPHLIVIEGEERSP